MIPIYLALALGGQTLDLSILPSGAFERIHAYRPFALKLSSAKPEGLKKAPEMASPRYGSIQVGTHTFLVALDGDDKLYVDSNGDGDLTDDPPAEWGLKTVKGRDGTELSYLQGTAVVDLNVGGKRVPCTIGLYKNVAFYGYYMDFALAGKATLAGKTYNSIYIDETAAWDGTKGILLIDEKGDGHLGPRSMHPVGQPFMLGGKEYEFGAAKGSYAVLRSNKKIVEPVERDPNEANGLKAGLAALTFDATTMSGEKVSFPSSFKGKVVMLDFWATWCGPCMHEVPNVVKAYQAYHDKGFEVLGVSLDQENSASTVKDVAAKQGMTWEQVYDGSYFKAAVAQRYQIKAIPEAYLVDGDTGKIIACGDAVRGEKLAPAIEKALASKRGQRSQ